jgi:hypothetical protein
MYLVLVLTLLTAFWMETSASPTMITIQNYAVQGAGTRLAVELGTSSIDRSSGTGMNSGATLPKMPRVLVQLRNVLVALAITIYSLGSLLLTLVLVVQDLALLR